jgi:hypothetical protein
MSTILNFEDRVELHGMHHPTTAAEDWPPLERFIDFCDALAKAHDLDFIISVPLDFALPEEVFTPWIAYGIKGPYGPLAIPDKLTGPILFFQEHTFWQFKSLSQSKSVVEVLRGWHGEYSKDGPPGLSPLGFYAREKLCWRRAGYLDLLWQAAGEDRREDGVGLYMPKPILRWKIPFEWLYAHPVDRFEKPWQSKAAVSY